MCSCFDGSMSFTSPCLVKMFEFLSQRNGSLRHEAKDPF